MYKYRIYDKEEKEYCEEPDHRWFLTRAGRLYNSENDKFHDIGERYLVEFWTGVKDKNKRDIYDGDTFNIKGATYFVQYIEDQCNYVLTTGFGYDTRNCFDLTCDSIFYDEISGNKHGVEFYEY